MFRKLVTLFLVVLVINLVGVRLAMLNQKKRSRRALPKRLKQMLKARYGRVDAVKIKLRDKAKLEGFISESGAETFTRH